MYFGDETSHPQLRLCLQFQIEVSRMAQGARDANPDRQATVASVRRGWPPAGFRFLGPENSRYVSAPVEEYP